jgi:hypothetical protein
MFVGGLLNTAVNTQYGDGGYEHAQALAGGALSVYAGTGKLVKGKKLFSNPAFKKAETFLKYGAQSTAYDFANTDEKYFTTRTWYGHAGMFAAGGAAGVAGARFFTGPNPGISKFGSIGIGVGVYATEWTITSRIKHGSYARYNGYAPRGFYSGRSHTAKGWILGGKWLKQSYNILFLNK